jgi:ankyrin repeat protein
MRSFSAATISNCGICCSSCLLRQRQRSSCRTACLGVAGAPRSAASAKRDPSALQLACGMPGSDYARMTAALQLRAAGKAGNCRGITAALTAGAAVDGVETERYETPLIIAVLRRHVDAVRLLLRRGASVRAVRRCDPPLWHVWFPLPPRAEWEACVAIATLLLAAGAQADLVAGDGRTPLHHAAWAGCVAGVMQLVAAGSDARVADAAGSTPLHSAAKCEDAGADPAGCILALLAAGADPRATNAHGWGALHYAAARCAACHLADVTRLLVGAGAQVNMLCHRGSSVLELLSVSRSGDDLATGAAALLAVGAVPVAANGWWGHPRVAGLSRDQRAGLLREAAWARRGHLLRLRWSTRQAQAAAAGDAGEGSRPGRGQIRIGGGRIPDSLGAGAAGR